MSKINYIGFARMGNIYGPAHGLGDYTPTLPAGHYKVAWNRYTDEIPGAYKNIDEVMANQSDLVEVLHELKQIMCIKG